MGLSKAAIQLRQCTVADLPTSARTNSLRFVTDATHIGDVTTGGGSVWGFVAYTGSAWEWVAGVAFVDSSGNVGIGTPSPISPLEIKKSVTGDLFLTVQNTGTGSGDDATLLLRSSGPSGGDALVALNVPGALSWSMGLDNSDSDKLKFGTSLVPGSNTHLTIDTSGNVGIGTASPNVALDVDGYEALRVQSGDPATQANAAHIYAKDVLSSAEVFVRDEAGNVSQISPHDEENRWAPLMKAAGGGWHRVKMWRVIELLEELTGESLIEDVEDEDL